MAEEKKILHLTLKKKWFDMIASGEKKEEYRKINDYWSRRLCGKEWFKYEREILFKVTQKFDIIKFRNGYSPQSPVMEVECMDIRTGYGRYEWGAIEESFVIRLGKTLSIKNYNSKQTIRPL